MLAEEAALKALVNQFYKHFTALENSMADLLYHVIFWDRIGTDSNVAHEIYFSPESFGARRAIVNNAVTAWLDEHPIGKHDYPKLWKRLNNRINTIREVRNTIAHGAVDSLMFGSREDIHVRVVPPLASPRLQKLVRENKVPGRTAAEIENANGAVSGAIDCIKVMARAIEYCEEDDETLRDTFQSLEFHLNRLDNWYPIFQNTQEPINPP